MFFFKAKDGTQLYMGKDKYENEELIKWGWPEDIWFHVDNLSSAHVYVRLAQGTATDSPAALGPAAAGSLVSAEAIAAGNALLDRISEDVIRDCAQLVKENSIEGCKKPSVTVVYTPWSNLKKTGGMEVGQVGFHVEKLVRKYVVLEKDRDTLRRIEKSREEKHPDLKQERDSRDVEERAKLKAEQKAKAAADRELAEQRKKEKELRSYDRLFAKKDEQAGSPFAVAGGSGAAAAGGGAAGGGAKKGGKGKGKYEEREVEDEFAGMSIKPTKDASAAKAAEEDFM